MVKTGTLLRVLGSQPAAATAAQEAASYSAFKLIRFHPLYPKLRLLPRLFHLFRLVLFLYDFFIAHFRLASFLFSITLLIFYTFRMYENAFCQLLYLITTSYCNVYVLGRSSWNLGCARTPIYLYIETVLNIFLIKKHRENIVSCQLYFLCVSVVFFQASRDICNHIETHIHTNYINKKKE